VTADRARRGGGDQRFRGSAQLSDGPGRSSRGTMLDRLTYTRGRVTRPAHEGRARVAVVGRWSAGPRDRHGSSSYVAARVWVSALWVDGPVAKGSTACSGQPFGHRCQFGSDAGDRRPSQKTTKGGRNSLCDVTARHHRSPVARAAAAGTGTARTDIALFLMFAVFGQQRALFVRRLWL
jgi:hypothetical protein